jgi:hypothetical protein
MDVVAIITVCQYPRGKSLELSGGYTEHIAA